MNIHKFNELAKETEPGHWVASEGDTIYVRSTTIKAFKCPPHLNAYKNVYMWEVDHNGKRLKIGDLIAK